MWPRPIYKERFFSEVFFRFFFLITRLYSLLQSPFAAVKKKEEEEEEQERKRKAGRLHFIFCPFDIVATEDLSSFFF